MNIAILSPANKAYSETFIQAHKKYLKGNIFYFFSGELPTEIEGGVLFNSRRKRMLYILKGSFQLNRFSLKELALLASFKRNKIDLVFAEYGGTGEAVVAICKKLKLPLIVHFHGFDASHKNQLAVHNQYKRIFNYARFIIAVSRKMERDLIELGCPREKLVYTVCGPEKEFFNIQPAFTKQQFIAACRFVNKKAPYYLILSFLEVIKEFPSAKLLIAGKGELHDTCQNLIRFYNLDKNVKLTGVLTPEKFRDYLKESQALVQHSIITDDGDSEGTPVVILEAGAAGLPVIATNHAGIPDVIINGETGFLTEEHDVQGMADNMIKILKDVELAREIGKRAKKHIHENYTMESHIKILNGLIKTTLSCDEE